MEKASQPAVKLKSFGSNLDDLMQALSVIRPAETANFATELAKIYPTVAEDLNNISQTRPLKLLFEDIKKQVSELNADQNNLFSDQGIAMQANMVRHYLKTGQYQQAVTLAREAMISLMVLEQNGNPFEKDDRKKASDYLYECRERSKGSRAEQVPVYHQRIMETEHRLGDIRNDLNHAAMREKPTPATTLIKNIRNYCQDAIGLMENPSK